MKNDQPSGDGQLGGDDRYHLLDLASEDDPTPAEYAERQEEERAKERVDSQEDEMRRGLRMLAVKAVLEDEWAYFLALPTMGNLTRLRYLAAEYADAWTKLEPERVDAIRAYFTGQTLNEF